MTAYEYYFEKYCADRYPIREIKDDIYIFIQQWIPNVLLIEGVKRIDGVWQSEGHNFTNYIQLSFRRPKNNDVYIENKNLYDYVIFRFSDILNSKAYIDIKGDVNFVGKSFDDASIEMEDKIRIHIERLKKLECK